MPMLLVGEPFDVNKRDGVKFIRLLELLSKLYGNSEDGSELIFAYFGMIWPAISA